MPGRFIMVGAGPCGLLLSALLLKHDPECTVLLLDAKPHAGGTWWFSQVPAENDENDEDGTAAAASSRFTHHSPQVVSDAYETVARLAEHLGFPGVLHRHFHNTQSSVFGRAFRHGAPTWSARCAVAFLFLKWALASRKTRLRSGTVADAIRRFRSLRDVAHVWDGLCLLLDGVKASRMSQHELWASLNQTARHGRVRAPCSSDAVYEMMLACDLHGGSRFTTHFGARVVSFDRHVLRLEDGTHVRIDDATTTVLLCVDAASSRQILERSVPRFVQTHAPLWHLTYGGWSVQFYYDEADEVRRVRDGYVFHSPWHLIALHLPEFRMLSVALLDLDAVAPRLGVRVRELSSPDDDERLVAEVWEQLHERLGEKAAALPRPRPRRFFVNRASASAAAPVLPYANDCRNADALVSVDEASPVFLAGPLAHGPDRPFAPSTMEAAARAALAASHALLSASNAATRPPRQRPPTRTITKALAATAAAAMLMVFFVGSRRRRRRR